MGWRLPPSSSSSSSHHPHSLIIQRGMELFYDSASVCLGSSESPDEGRRERERDQRLFQLFLNPFLVLLYSSTSPQQILQLYPSISPLSSDPPNLISTALTWFTVWLNLHSSWVPIMLVLQLFICHLRMILHYTCQVIFYFFFLFLIAQLVLFIGGGLMVGLFWTITRSSSTLYFFF